MTTEIHELVRKAYTEAVMRPQGGCCGGAPKGVLAGMAGYTSSELSAVPGDAVANSFGCGNPLAFSEVQSGETVLDLGSGAGIDLLIAAQRVGPTGRVIGVDMTEAMIERARRNIKEAGIANTEVREGLIEALPVDTASVDWVISNCVINLSPDKPRVFTEIFRVLRPGGRVLVSDVVARDLPAKVRANASLYGSCIAGAISEDEYVAGLQLAGLVDVEVRQRFTYDTGQLCRLAASESGLDDTIAPLAQRLSGKVWSAMIFARKPKGR